MRPSAYRKWRDGRLRILPPQEFDEKVRKGEYQEHRFDGFAVYTQITDYDNERVLDVVLLIGEGYLEKKNEVDTHLVAFAKQYGCQAVEALSRPGLETVLKPLGWKRTRIVMRKEI